MKSTRSDHSPGSQGHDETLRRQISKLQDEHSKMMGNQHNPDYDERVQDKGLTERLYHEQAPKDYGSRQITGHRRGNNRGPSRVRRGDNGGTEY